MVEEVSLGLGLHVDLGSFRACLQGLGRIFIIRPHEKCGIE